MNPNRLARLLLASLLVIIPVSVSVSHRGAMGQPTRSIEGTIEIPNCYVKFYRTAGLATDRPGVIAEMPFDEGDRVEKGDLVVRLRDDVAVANLALATERAASQAAVLMAEKEAEAAAVEYRSHLRANGTPLRGFPSGSDLVPGSIVEQSRLIMEAREAGVIRAQDEVKLNARAQDQAEAELKSFQIVSKQSGVVTRVHKREGEAVQQGEAIVEVVDPTVARIEGKLEFAQARHLRVGMPVEVQLDFEEADLPIEQEVFVGTIGFIDVSAPSGLDVRVWAEVQNRDGILLHDLPARMIVRVRD